MGKMKERSSLTSSMGSSRRYDRELYPVPKPSMDIWIPP